MQVATTINTEYTDLSLVWKCSVFIGKGVHQIF